MRKGISKQAKIFRESEFQTPIEVCKYMISLLPPPRVLKVGRYRRILEPTPGEGNLVRELQSAGYQTVPAENFFDLAEHNQVKRIGYTYPFDAVVMNPPFSWELVKNIPDWLTPADRKKSCAHYFLHECLYFAPVVIALLPWNSLLDSVTSTDMMRNFGLKSVTALPRNTFKKAAIRTGIYNLERGYIGKTELKFV